MTAGPVPRTPGGVSVGAPGPSSGPVAHRFRLTAALDGWQGGTRTVFGRSHAVALAALRTVDAGRAAALHDGGARKPWALGPLVIEPRRNGLALLTLDVACWDEHLTGLLADACTAADGTSSLHALGHPLQILDWAPAGHAALGALLAAPDSTTVCVEFTTPTLFGLGRANDGRQRYGLLPDPGLVFASWTRAWGAAGGPLGDAQGSPEWWAERVVLENCDGIRTLTVPTAKTGLTGFVGRAGYAWAGDTGARDLFAALARFASWCGTGAKTGHGFGQTRPVAPPSVASDRPRSTAPDSARPPSPVCSSSRGSP